MSGDIDVSTFDVLNIDRATFADDSSSITANNIAQMLLNSSGSLQTNVDIGNDFVWTILNDTILTVQEDVSNNSVLTLQSLDDTGGAVVNVFRNDIDSGVPSPLVIGSYSFQTGTTGTNDVGDYATIQGVAEVVTSGAIEGSMDLLAADGDGAQSTFISINDGANNLVDIFKVLDMNANKILNVVDPTADQEVATKKYVDDTTGTQSSIVDDNTTATVLDSAPSFSVVLDGVQKFSIANTRVDYEELDLFGVTSINMNDSGATLISTLTASLTGLLLNIISTSDVYDIKFNSADAFHVDEIRTRILSTTPNTVTSELSLFRDDPSPAIGNDLGVIKFDGRNSAAEFINYALWAGGIDGVTDGDETGAMTLNLITNGTAVNTLRVATGSLRVNHFSSVATEKAILKLVKEDATPGADDVIGSIDYILDDVSDIV